MAEISFNIPPGAAASTSTLAAGAQAAGAFQIIDPVSFLVTGWRYTFPDPKLRPRRAVAVRRIYLPVAILTSNDAAAPQAHAADILVSFRVAGQMRWSYGASVTLVPNANTVNSVGNSVISDDLINPVDVELQEYGELDYNISFDQQVNAWWFYISCQIPQGNTIVVTPGTMSTTYEQ